MTRRCLPVVALFALVISGSEATAVVAGQAAAPSLRLISASESKFQAELDKAAADGYRLVAGNAAVEVVVMERTADSTRRAYVFAADVESFLKDKKLQPGFKLVASTFAGDDYAFSAVFERIDDDNDLRAYRFMRVGSANALRNKYAGGGEGSAGIVAVAAGPRGFASISEARAQAQPAALISSGDTGTLTDDFRAAGEKGLCVIDSDGMKGATYVLERCTAASPTRGYEVIATTKTETFEKELNAAAARGKRFVPTSLVAIQKKLLFNTYNNETVGVVEQGEGGTAVTYHVLGAVRSGTIAKEMQAAADEGFTLVAFTLGPKEAVAVFEKKM